MINTLVRVADSKDHPQISNLILFETRLHRHLDWRAPLDWLGDRFYWALDEGGRITAALACPTEGTDIAWVRLFVYSGRWSADSAWNILWNTAKDEVARAGGATVAAIAMQPWFQQVLAANGFENRQQIVMLEWRVQPWARTEANGIRIRPMTEADLTLVEKTDAASFPPLWQNPLETLQKALKQSLFATVAENEQGIVGYQLTTGGGQRAHLARLAVCPDLQGRGFARSLLNDLSTRLTHHGIGRLSVNTQHDNLSSLSLYQKMGFTRTGEQFPVYTLNVTAGP